MQTLTDTGKWVLEEALMERIAERKNLRHQLLRLEHRIENLRADLGILTEPTDTDAAVPFEVIDDPWATPMTTPAEAQA